jgi:plasmid maintenance system antidote protein VapI
LRLSKFFDTTPGFWMNLQLPWDLYHAQRSEATDLKKIRRRRPKRQSTHERSAV